MAEEDSNHSDGRLRAVRRLETNEGENPGCLSMYELVCKSEFEGLNEKIDDLSGKLLDNPHGLLPKVIVNEERIRVLMSRWKWIITGIITLAAAIVGRIAHVIITYIMSEGG